MLDFTRSEGSLMFLKNVLEEVVSSTMNSLGQHKTSIFPCQPHLPKLCFLWVRMALMAGGQFMISTHFPEPSSVRHELYPESIKEKKRNFKNVLLKEFLFLGIYTSFFLFYYLQCN